MATTQRARLTEGPVARTLVNLTIPMILGTLGMAAFNLVDTFFVGQLGSKELAAMSFTFPVVMIVASLSMGLGMGASAIVSRTIGEGDQQGVKRLTTDSLALSVLLVAGFVILGILTIDPVFTLLGATPDILPLIRQYMAIWYLGMIAVVIPMVGNSLIRATGDTLTPTLVMLSSIIVNIILDPILIFGLGPFPELGLTGAAIATVAGRSIALVFSLWILYFRDKMITLAKPKLSDVLISWRQVLYIGFPAAATAMIVPLSAAIITRLIAGFGPTAVAAFGVATRIETLALIVVMALSQVMSPFVGQNWGARQYERAELGVKYSEQFTMGWGVVMAILLALIGGSLATLFNDDPEVVATVSLYFLIVPLSYGLQGVLRLSATVLNVLKKPLRATVLVLIQTFALYIPLAYVGSELFGLAGVFGAASLSYVITGIAAYFWLKRSMTESMEYDYLERIVTTQEIKDRPASLGYWMASLHRSARVYIDQALSQYHLETPTLAYLATLFREDGLTKQEMSAKLQVNEAVTSRAISTLTDLGYVRLGADGQDGHRDNVFLTQKARDISADVRDVMHSWSEILAGDFTEEEREMALTLLQRMHVNAVSALESMDYLETQYAIP